MERTRFAIRVICNPASMSRWGLAWQEYCPCHAGMTRERADLLIRQFDEFGEYWSPRCERRGLQSAFGRNLMTTGFEPVVIWDCRPDLLRRGHGSVRGPVVVPRCGG